MRALNLLALILVFFSSCSAQEEKRHTYKTYFPNGRVKAITEMVDGRKDGKEELYWGNGNIFMIQYFKDDLLIDSCWQFDEHESGKVVFRGFSYLKSKFELYRINGQLGADNEYDPKMVTDGLVKLYRTEDGGVQSIKEYKKGKPDGIAVLYWMNGNIAKIKHHKNGEVVPPIIEFDSSGRLVNFINASEVKK